MTRTRAVPRGVTLLELLVVIMILSLILTAAVKTWDVTLERGRFESTRRKLNQLSSAIVGSEDYIVSGSRVDFGYVGDCGELPSSLDDLVRIRPGVSDTVWRGPYVRATFNESPDGYRIDGWGDSIVYSKESLFVRSYGGGGLVDRSKWITRSFGYSADELEGNLVRGRVLDVRGVPVPDSLFNEINVAVEFRGAKVGVWQRYPVFYETNGQFEVAAVPQGNRYEVRAVFRFVRPPYDSVWTTKNVTVYPGAGANDIQLRLNTDWSAF